MKLRTSLLALLSLPIGGCATLADRLRVTDQPPEAAPLVISPACLVGPVEPNPVEEPPMPEPIERPAGEPNATNWPAWMAYVDRRRERAELAGLYYQGERNAVADAYEMNAATQERCKDWAQSQDQ